MDIKPNPENPNLIESFNGISLNASYQPIEVDGRYIFAVNNRGFASGIINKSNTQYKRFHTSLGYDYDWDYAYERARSKHLTFIQNGGV